MSEIVASFSHSTEIIACSIDNLKILPLFYHYDQIHFKPLLPLNTYNFVWHSSELNVDKGHRHQHIFLQ